MTELPVVAGPFALEFCRFAELEAPGFSPSDWLSPSEQAALAKFPAEKRRRDWLAGRIAAKRALAKLWGREPRECAVEPDEAGRPRAAGLGGTLSITHCALGGAAAAAKTGRVGLDWETVEERDLRVAELFSSEEERGSFGTDAVSVTRLWTLKEAALKLVGTGLEDGGRAARVLLTDGAPQVEFLGAARAAWRALGAPRVEFFESREPGSCLAVATTGG